MVELFPCLKNDSDSWDVIILEHFTTTIVDLTRRQLAQFATIKSQIDAVIFSNTI
jgi:hypothetical protein